MANAAEITLDGAQVMAASMDAMAVIDGEQYVSVNQPYADLYGFARPEDLDSEPWDRRLAESERSRFELDVLPTCRADGQWRGRVAGRRRDGSTFPQELSIARLADDQFICIVRATADDERPGRRNRLVERVFDTVDDIVYVLDEDGSLVLWNAKLREVTGYTDAEIAAADPTEFVATDQHDHLPCLAGAVDELGDRQADLDIVTGDGERIPHEFRESAFEDPQTGGIYRCGIARDITDRTERERELGAARQFNQELVENAPFGMFRLDDDLRITYENPRAEEIIGLPTDEESSAAIGVDIRELPSIVETGEAELFSRLLEGETIEFEFPFESIYGAEAYFTGRGVPLYRDGEFDGALLMANDISERRRHERELERQRDELTTLDRINELLLEVTRDLFESPTRTEIEQVVCDRLAASELYQFAWIGEPERRGKRIVPRASAGIDDGYVEAITVTTAEEGPGRGPGGRALRTGRIQVSQDIHSDPSFEPWREEALDRDVKSVAAVPLVHGDTTYGVLAVYATRPLAFSQREQAGFETLGKAVGFAINAIENRRLLFADSVVELELEVTDSELVFVRASDRLDCELTITGYVESASGGWSVYLSVDGATPAGVRDVATEDPDVDRVRVIADEGDSGLVEFVLKGPALNEITEKGAILTSGHADAGRGRFSVEAPPSADVRRLTDRLQAVYPDSTLIAQREFDRPVQKALEMRQSIDDRLTERQQEAFERAYHAGYFDWPRRSTAGDIAESMDLAETTFHYHLRNALHTLSSTLVDFEKR
ncbi:bacterio-opsin activator domain-containing protein [Halostella pelagica]|uniref:bacterio-opsin activator domain-containing protein n=1 Tax=Halostella pelagica TaxID=2583824 RepID=UPI00192A5A06|nr:bacterio-opsin activator domain-containing protein [Halostella pelagica]